MEANSSYVIKLNINKPDRNEITLNNLYGVTFIQYYKYYENSLIDKCEDTAKKLTLCVCFYPS